MNEDLPIQVAVQLYTLRDALTKDFENTLKSLKDMGVKYVEIADTGTLSLSEYTKRLMDCSLYPISAHIDFLVLRNDVNEVIKECTLARINKVVVPWIDPQIWADPTLLEQVSKELERLGKILNESGIILLYHNHAHELAVVQGKYLLDKFIEQTQNVQLELDLGWGYVATQETPVRLVQRFHDRIQLFHLKDIRSITPLKFTELNNQGLIPWHTVLPEIYKKNKSPWIIEQDADFEKDSLESVKTSFEFVRTALEVWIK